MPGRGMQDNIEQANAAFYNKAERCEVYMFLLHDFQKAYDSLSRRYLFSLLLPCALEGAVHVRRVPEAVTSVGPEVRQRAVLLWERVLGRAQEVGLPLLGNSERRGTVAY